MDVAIYSCQQIDISSENFCLQIKKEHFEIAEFSNTTSSFFIENIFPNKNATTIGTKNELFIDYIMIYWPSYAVLINYLPNGGLEHYVRTHITGPLYMD